MDNRDHRGRLNRKGLLHEVFLFEIVNRLGSHGGRTGGIAAGVGDFFPEELAKLGLHEGPGPHIL